LVNEVSREWYSIEAFIVNTAQGVDGSVTDNRTNKAFANAVTQ
jgi:hypothetical protein